MSVNLQKGQKVSLTKDNPTLSKNRSRFRMGCSRT